MIVGPIHKGFIMSNPIAMRNSIVSILPKKCQCLRYNEGVYPDNILHFLQTKPYNRYQHDHEPPGLFPAPSITVCVSYLRLSSPLNIAGYFV